MHKNDRVVIVGGGLSGLTLAYLLNRKSIETTLLEASSRLGGRIQTIQGALSTPLELGATWFSDMHPKLLSLISELGLEKFPQFSKGISLFQTKSFEPPQKFFVPEAETPSYRLQGGTQRLTDRLAKQLPGKCILLNTRVEAIKDRKSSLLVETSNGPIDAGHVVMCIPPQLIAKQIAFSPPLPDDVAAVLPTVHTWMAGAVKFTLEYDQPFWRNAGYSGMLYSHAGIITEMYDHTSVAENQFGFTGFLAGNAVAYSPQIRKELVLNQLGELLGAPALKPTAYFDKVWADKFIRHGEQVIQRPHQNNGHSLLQESYMSGRLFFAATETASESPGYMEGAVSAARYVAEKIWQGCQTSI